MEHNLTINVEYCSARHNHTGKDGGVHCCLPFVRFRTRSSPPDSFSLLRFPGLTFFFHCVDFLGFHCWSSHLISDIRIPTSTFFASPLSFPPYFLLYYFCLPADNGKAWALLSCHHWNKCTANYLWYNVFSVGSCLGSSLARNTQINTHNKKPFKFLWNFSLSDIQSPNKDNRIIEISFGYVFPLHFL